VERASVHIAVLVVAADPATVDLANATFVTDRASGAGHRIVAQEIVEDREAAIRDQLARWIAQPHIDVIVSADAGDDATAALAPLVTKPLPGLTDQLRLLARDRGSSSRPVAARCDATIVFLLPPEMNALGAAINQLVLPQLDSTAERNLVGEMPRHRADAVPQSVALERTASGAGVLPKMPAMMREKRRTGANVIARREARLEDQARALAQASGAPPGVQDTTRLIERDKLEQRLAQSSRSHDSPTRPHIDLATMRPASGRADTDEEPTVPAPPVYDPVSPPVTVQPARLRGAGSGGGARGGKPAIPATPPPTNASITAKAPVAAPTPVAGVTMASAPLTSSAVSTSQATPVGKPNARAARSNGAPPAEPTSDEAIEVVSSSEILSSEVVEAAEFEELPTPSKPMRPVSTGPVGPSAGAPPEPPRPFAGPELLDLREGSQRTRRPRTGTALIRPTSSRIRPILMAIALAAAAVAGFFVVVRFVPMLTGGERPDEPSANGSAVVAMVTTAGSAATPPAPIVTPAVEVPAADAPPAGSAETPPTGPGGAAAPPETPADTAPPATVPSGVPTPRPPARHATARKGTTPDNSEKTAAAKSEAPEPAKTDAAKADPAEGCDEVSCVMGHYERACCARFKPADTEFHPRGSIPDQLDKSMVKAGIEKVKPKVIACGEKIAVKGTVKLSITVGAEGNVADISVAEAPDAALGDCVLAAVKKAAFGKAASATTFTYPFAF
jgi:TonB family protein